MAKKNDIFEIKDSSLVKYHGQEREVVIPEGVEYIGAGAFEDNLDVEKVWLPASLQSANATAFRNCKNLKVFEIHPDNDQFSCQNGALLSRISQETGDLAEWTLLCAPSAEGDYIVPPVREVFRYAFADEKDIESVVVPGTVWLLRTRSFMNCKHLERVELQEGVQHLDFDVFYGAKNLKEISLPQSLQEIADRSFMYSGLEKITFPPKLKKIYAEVFAYSKLASVVLPLDVEVGKSAFAHIPTLKEVTVACDIPKSCFAGCPVESLTIQGAVQIAPSAFDSTKLKQVIADEMPLRDLPKGAVLQAALLTFARRTLAGEQLPRQQEYFSYIKSQRKRLYPLAVEHQELLQLMFQEEIVPSDDLPLLQQQARELKNDAAKDAIQQYQKQLASSPAKGTKKKTAKKPAQPARPKGPTVAEMKKIWNFKKLPDDTLKLTAYKKSFEKGEEKKIVVPGIIGKSAVTQLEGTFGSYKYTWYAGYAETIVLPDSLQVIGDGAFDNCRELKQLDIPAGVTKIGANAFFYTTSLQTVSLPANLQFLGEDAFKYSGIQEIVLPDSLQELGSYSFSECKNLTSITLPKGLQVLPDFIFEDCSALETIQLPQGLKKIGNHAFRESGLTSLVIPEGVEEIGVAAFFRCNKLASLTIPASVKRIGHGAFGVDGLKPYKHIEVTIHAPAGSYGEQYAKQNKIEFEAL